MLTERQFEEMEGTVERADSDIIEVVDCTANDPLSAELGDFQDKPLMMLFKRLIGNDSKQNTVLTNAQIIDILQKEFNMDTVYAHVLEIDIYLNILKKFLKDWPQWDEFDSAINTLKSQKDYEKIKSMLETNYQSLKEYLSTTLKSVEPLLKKTIKDVKNSERREAETEDDIVMELQCTRAQLNELFYRRPHPDNNVIFNIIGSPNKILLIPFTLVSMLNWPGIKVSFLFDKFAIKREIRMTLKHVLVNKKLKVAKKPPVVLDTRFQEKPGARYCLMKLNMLKAKILAISQVAYDDYNLKQVIRTICKLLKSDLEDAPDLLWNTSEYRMCLSESPYVRYLYTDVPVTSGTYTVNNYDIQLEETGIPQVWLSIPKFTRVANVKMGSGQFLKVECTTCGVVFGLDNLCDNMKAHYEECHNSEPDWMCTRCHRYYSMQNLTRVNWWHVCKPTSDDN